MAMSGGVDSSVAAALLVKAGYEVIGIMLRLWTSGDQDEENKCCAPEAVSLARQVAGILKIPFYALDAVEPFKEKVVDYLLRRYGTGETPNPCIMCNRHIRWGFLLDRADVFGAEFLATGHYARLLHLENEKIKLFKGADDQKDQSYVLAGLNQKQLARTIFPLSDLSKMKVRKIAAELDLPVADRPDSQDLCFLGSSSIEDFLKKNIKGTMVMPGEIRDTQGNYLGQHQGLVYYTIGQRKNIRIPASYPLYVVNKEIQNNVLIVGGKDELGRNDFYVSEINWIDQTPDQEMEVEVKIRYKSPLIKVRIIPINDNQIKVMSHNLIRDITPGQFCVFYMKDEVLGGGFISYSIKVYGQP